MTNNEKGMAPVLILFVLGILIILAGAGSYYILKGSGKTLFPTDKTAVTEVGTSATPAPVSNSNDINTIEKELNNTNEGSMDSDLNTIDSTAASL